MVLVQLTYRESLRDIEACTASTEQALSHGHPLQGRTQYTFPFQRATQLVHLCRLRASLDSSSQNALCKRRSRSGT
ncbi:DUF4372 domain-containing protein [Candidatus Vondammii sp. HM_W22]|uniref:DUF4372 domain-containing protein n=1 Tax=Candidatus Vondammii sp. HM_W22 TaxID=2687299 RepID=UPI00403E1BD3